MATLKIHKYSNRRYYDATESRHITLEEMHTKICEGHDIQVKNRKTDTDITAKVLAQILLEHDPTKLDFFPTPLLLQMIRTNEKLLGEFIDKYFNQAFQTFLSSMDQFENMVRQTHGLFPQPNPFLGWMAHSAQQTHSESREETPSDTTLHQTVQDLQNQITALQEQLNKQGQNM